MMDELEDDVDDVADDDHDYGDDFNDAEDERRAKRGTSECDGTCEPMCAWCLVSHECPTECAGGECPYDALERHSIEAPHLAEIERLKVRVAALEASRIAVVATLGEALRLLGESFDVLQRKGLWPDVEALKTYHASLTQEPPADLPAPGRDRDAPRRPTVSRMDAAPERDEQDHVHEVGSCSFCDRALRQRATPCLTWQGPEYGGRCRACGGSKEEHQGTAK